MKNRIICLLLFAVLINGKSMQAQILFAGAGTEFSIVAGTVVSAGGLELTPATLYSFSNNTLIKSSSVNNSTSINYVRNVYQFSNTENAYTGALKMYYEIGALNGLIASSLKLLMYNGTSWSFDNNSISNTASNMVYNNSVSGVSLREITASVCTPNTGDTTVTVCGSFIWYGVTYNSSATPTQTFTNSGGCDSVVTLHLTINSVPSSPSGTGSSRCSTGTLSISATPSGGETIDWYAASSGGSVISSGSTSYTIPNIATSTTYFAAARNTSTGCTSTTRTSVAAIVYPVTTSSVSAGGPTTFNYGGSVQLSGVLTVPSEGNALSLNGTSNYVSIPSGINSNFSGNQITIEGWFYPTQSFPKTALIGETFEGDGKIKFALFSEDVGGGVQNIRAGFYSPSTDWVQVTSSANFSFNQWTHIAATYDQTNVKIYVNGALTCTLANTNALPTGSERWLLGKKWDEPNYFPGKMDEIRIWNVARTQTQIQNSMNSTISPTTSGLVGYYKMDEASGNSAADATGHGYTGTVN